MCEFASNISASTDAAYLPQVLRSLALWKKEHKASHSYVKPVAVRQ